MTRYELTKEALGDIDELWLYIAEDSIDAANRVSDAILDACDLLSEQPLVGHARPDLTERPVLFWSSGKYLIVYRPETNPIRIIAVFHSSRDVATLLTDRG
jgi:plasmid stabilization system protein ParE